MLPPSTSKTLAAATLVWATTVDDCVWLVPMMVGRPFPTQVLHAACFVLTLVGTAGGLCYGTEYAGASLLSNQGVTERQLELVAALLCWAIALTLLVRKWLKQRRRQAASLPTMTSSSGPTAYGSVPTTTTPTEEPTEQETGPQPCLVVSLTLLGFLDEICYFPALVLGNVWTATELTLGTLLAAVGMLLLISCCLGPFRPCLHCLDQIPLWAVVAVFASLLTLHVIVSD